MSKINFAYFKENFKNFEFQVIRIKRYFLGKYMEFNIKDGKEINKNNLFIKTQELKRLYKKIKQEYHNFNLSTDHSYNIQKIISQSKLELDKNRLNLVKILFEFFEGFINSQKQEIQKTQPQGELEEQLKQELNQERKVSVQKVNQQQLSQGQQNIRNLYKEIFLRPDHLFEVSFPHLLLYKNFLKNFQIKRTQSDLFQVKFRYSNKFAFQERFAFFKNRSIYLYKEEINYMEEENSFQELLILIRIDNISYKHLNEQKSLIVLKNENNWNNFEFVIQRKEITTFLFAICIELVKDQSTFVIDDNLPDPPSILGNFILSIDKTDNYQTQKNCIIKSNFLEIEIQKLRIQQIFIIPILNIFDIYEIKIDDEFIYLEAQDIFDFKYSSKKTLFQFTGYRLSIQRFTDPLKAYLHPLPLNYHESQLIKKGLKKNYGALKRSTFRLKRFIAGFRNISQILVHFTCFKYKSFTTFIFILSILINLFWTLEIYFLVILFFMLFYNHPKMNQKLSPFINKIFFEEKNLHKDYIAQKLETNAQKDRDFYLNIHNLNSKNKGKKLGLKTKISNAFKFSGKVPIHINFFTDIFDKIKNIFLWKNQRKTEMFLFLIIAILFCIFVISKENLFILYILFRFWKGRNYFTRLKQWNIEAIHACLRYFIKNELGHIQLQDPLDYFDLNQNDEIEKQQFSKKFSQFVLKYLDISVDDDYWIDKFNFQSILDQLLHSEKRMIVPFYEKKRQLPMRLQIYYFLFTTPSDIYYEELNESQKQTIQQLQMQKQKQLKKNSQVTPKKLSESKVNQFQVI